tara:strand:+ start:350 stop:547 length:198 start_codon:yes stop_codon:yes gene_type:complete
MQTKTKEITVEMAKEITKDWSEACRWVEHAVKREAERLMQEGENSPDAYLKAETLRAAWKRVQHG